jgi:hypothetical protein
VFSLREGRMTRWLSSGVPRLTAALIGTISGVAAYAFLFSGAGSRYGVLTADYAVGKPALSCEIKGNISASGERIYHVPGQQYYSQTVVSVTKGERWFCSEQEAREGGWRKSRL